MIKINEIELKSFTFSGGERQIKLESDYKFLSPNAFDVKCFFKSSDDLIDLILTVDAIRESYINPTINLDIPYFPYARQDRQCEKFEAHSLRSIVNIIRSLNFDKITVVDPHSDVLLGMFDAGKLVVINQWDIIEKLDLKFSFDLISPDGGALKKINKVADVINNSNEVKSSIVYANKYRDTKTGNIIKTEIMNPRDSHHDYLMIFDDICDGGRTFIELAKIVKFTPELSNKKIVLYVTHGIFSQGLDVFKGYIDEIYCYNPINYAEKFVNHRYQF